MKKTTFFATLLTAFSLSFTAVAQDDVPFVTKALDDDGVPTFNWEKASAFVPILVSESVSEVLTTTFICGCGIKPMWAVTTMLA